MSDHLRYVAEGNDQADELAKEEAEECEAGMENVVARAVKESSERKYAAISIRLWKIKMLL